MNYIDIGFIVLLVLAFLFGLFGKAKMKIKSLLTMISATVVSYFTVGKLKNSLYSSVTIDNQSLGDFLPNKIEELLSGNDMLKGLKDTLVPLTDSIVTVLLFWIEVFVLMIIFGIIFRIIIAILTAPNKARAKSNGEKYKPMKAIRLLGIPSIITGAITWIWLLCPVLFLSPVLASAGNLIGLVPDMDEGTKTTITMLSDQFANSKLVDTTGKFFLMEDNKLTAYESNGEKKNAYNDLYNIQSLSKAAAVFTSIIPQDGEDVKPEKLIESFKEMSSEDLKDVMQALDDNKELITSIVPEETFTDLGIDIEKISFIEEAETLEVVFQAVEFDDETGEMSFSLDNVEPSDLAEAVATSNLLDSVLEPGMLADAVTEEQKDEIQSKFDEMLNAGDIDLDKYDKLMSYLTHQEE